jgi:hypothetical protein
MAKRQREEEVAELKEKVDSYFRVIISPEASEELAAVAAAAAAEQNLHFRKLRMREVQQRRYIGELEAINDALRRDNEHYFRRDLLVPDLKAHNRALGNELFRVQQQLREQNEKLQRLSLKWERRVIDEDLQ